MKEAVGESSMTLITIVLVGAALLATTVIIGYLLTSQSKRADCENAGGTYSNGECEGCTYDEATEEYNCG